MKINIKDCDINYIDYGKKDGKAIVLLHGWGQNIAMMKPVGDLLADNNRIIILDLPGFGDSSEPKIDFCLNDYYEVVKELLEKLHVENPTLVGHSFGGRVSIKYASKEKVYRLVLLSSPFIKRIKKDSFKTKMLKKLKNVKILAPLEEFAKEHMGSTDYRNASVMMRKILVNTVNEDLTDDVKKIKTSTIVIAGTLDEAVPISELMLYKDYIKDCEVVEYPNCTHYAYLEQLQKTASIIKALVGDNND